MTRIVGRCSWRTRALQYVGRALMACTLVVLGACTPEYNWRELTVAGGSLRVAFPGKLSSETRTLDVGGDRLPFTMSATQVGGAVFAVGHVDLPGDVARDPQRIGDIVRAVESSLARNLHGKPVVRGPVEVRYAHEPARRPLLAEEFEVYGTPAGEPMWLMGRVLVVGDRLIDVVALGPEKRLSRDVALTFLNSVRIQ